CVHAFSLPFVRPRPPTSTLFPYTTLFRSTIRVATRSLGGVGARLGEEPLTSMLGENAQPRLPGSWLHFEGQAGSIVRLRVTSSELDPIATLIGPSGQTWVNDDANDLGADGSERALDSTIVAALPESGV